jgi:hypothetical protein
LPTPLFARPKNSREIPVAADAVDVVPVDGTTRVMVPDATARLRSVRR